MTPDPICLRRETMLCDAREAVRWHYIGEPSFALHHIRKALGMASRLKDGQCRKRLMRMQNKMRRKS